MKHEALDPFTPFPGISEHVYCANDFAKVRALVYQASGIVLPPTKSTLVYSRLAPLVRQSGAATFARYIRRLDADEDERRRAVCALTTNHTAFFREHHHFDHFRDHVRPDLVRRIERGHSVRLWSAGSSSGEEAFSIAMTLLGEDRMEARRILDGDVAILATDIADPVLAHGRAAAYDAAALAPVPPALRRLWIKERAGGGTVVDAVRALMRFRHLNLAGEWPITRPFDAIFCRNVMIYFDQATKEALVSRFLDQLVPGGVLYVGHSERVSGPAAAYVEMVGKTIYRKRR